MKRPETSRSIALRLALVTICCSLLWALAPPVQNSRASAAFEGFHEFADCTQISGWAWDQTQPNTPISVDIYADGNLLITVLANQFRQDLLNAGKGNGNHGFSFPTPLALKDGAQHTITVAFANTSTALINSPKNLVCAPPTAAYEGFHENADCTQISGWAWDQSQPNTAISVDIFADGSLLTTVLANQFRQDLLNAGKGNGNHGFSIPTPLALKNGAQHSITIKFAGTSISLTNTPKNFICSPPAPVYEGFHEIADCTQISGWAWDQTQPNTPINVDIYSDGNLLTTVPANQFRQDLANAGKGNGSHGFSITTPNGVKDGQPHSITVKFGGSSTNLLNTPKQINCSGGSQPPSPPDLTHFQKGRLSSIGNGSMRISYGYDALGRSTGTVNVLDNTTYVYRHFYGYAQNGQSTPGPGTVLTSQLFPDGETVAYTYDLSGAQQSIVSTLPGGSPQTIIASVKRNARGQTIGVNYGDGTASIHKYNETSDLRLNQIQTAVGQVIVTNGDPSGE